MVLRQGRINRILRVIDTLVGAAQALDASFFQGDIGKYHIDSLIAERGTVEAAVRTGDEQMAYDALRAWVYHPAELIGKSYQTQGAFESAGDLDLALSRLAAQIAFVEGRL
jgi:hypothetical protein